MKTLLPSALLLCCVSLAAFGASAQPNAPERPRDPWVFRCVLDQRPRVVVIALSEDLYVAYDATNCNLYKAWQGDVKFDGAVYTTVHGPQPTSRGHDFVLEPEAEAWMLRQAGQPQSHPTPKWLGYRFINGQVHLRYSFEIAGDTVVVVEVPEVKKVGEEIVLERTLRVDGLPNGVFLGMTLPLYDTAGNALRQIIAGRPMAPKPGDTAKHASLPIGGGDLTIETYMPNAKAQGE